MTRPKSHSVREASQWRRLDESMAKADFAKFEEVKGESKSSPGREKGKRERSLQHSTRNNGNKEEFD